MAWYYQSMKKIFQKKIITKRPYSEAQKRQDEIFRRMSGEQKLKLGANLWQLGKKLAGDKINYAKR
jgi:hypothetical protein